MIAALTSDWTRRPLGLQRGEEPSGGGRMVQFSSVLFAQIRFLVQNLYKKNAKNNIAEVRPAPAIVPLRSWSLIMLIMPHVQTLLGRS